MTLCIGRHPERVSSRSWHGQYKIASEVSYRYCQYSFTPVLDWSIMHLLTYVDAVVGLTRDFNHRIEAQPASYQGGDGGAFIIKPMPLGQELPELRGGRNVTKWRKGWWCRSKSESKNHITFMELWNCSLIAWWLKLFALLSESVAGAPCLREQSLAARPEGCRT